MSFDYAVTSNSRVTFQNEVQFRIAAGQIAQEAAAEARRIESKFASFAEIREFVVAEAHENDRLRPSWFGYYAGIASTLEGRADDAAYFLTGLADERATKYADALVSKMGHPDCFAEEINRRVKEQRAILKLPELIENPF